MQFPWLLLALCRVVLSTLSIGCFCSWYMLLYFGDEYWLCIFVFHLAATLPWMVISLIGNWLWFLLVQSFLA